MENKNYYKETSVDQYFEEIKNIPLLTKEEEIELIKRIKNKDNSAYEVFIKANLKLVVYIAKHYQNKGLDLLDLIQEGNLGLMKAIDNFDPQKDCKFSTYATYWIKQSIGKGIISKSRTIRIPHNIYYLVNRYNKLNEEHLKQTGLPIDIDEAINNLSSTTSKAKRLKEAIKQQTVSLERIIEEEKNCPCQSYNTTNIEEQVIKTMLRPILEKLLLSLPEEEQKILRLHYGFDKEPVSYVKLGQKYNVTGECIRQIEKRALKRLRTKETYESLELY